MIILGSSGFNQNHLGWADTVWITLTGWSSGISL
jgi:hypothetical protein